MVHVSVEADRALIGLGGATRYLRVVVTAPAAPAGRANVRPAVNLGLVLDRSGSMGGEKIRLAQEAVIAALGRLEPRDRVSVVAYDDRIDVLVPSTMATSAAVGQAIGAVRTMTARGQTDLCGGWLRGCEQVAGHEAPGVVSRVLLLTDGLANHGVKDGATILGHAGQLRARGVATSTIGVGEDFDERLLGGMADAGGGHFFYVERGSQIPEAIATEVGEALDVTARAAGLRIEGAGLLGVDGVSGYPCDAVEGGWRVHLGDLVSSQEVELVVRLRFGSCADGAVAPVRVSVDAGGVLGAGVDVVFCGAGASALERQPRKVEVDRAVAAAYSARARREAEGLYRSGSRDEASRLLVGTAARIESYAGGDPLLLGLAAELREHEREVAFILAAGSMKKRFLASMASSKGRPFAGTSKKSWIASGPITSVAVVTLTDAHYVAAKAAASVLRELPLVAHEPGEAASLLSALAVRAGGVLSAEDEAVLVHRMRTFAEDMTVVVCDVPLADNWFSHWHPTERVAVVSTGAWASMTTVPLRAFLAYELVMHGLRAVSPSTTIARSCITRRAGACSICARTASTSRSSCRRRICVLRAGPGWSARECVSTSLRSCASACGRSRIRGRRRRGGRRFPIGLRGRGRRVRALSVEEVEAFARYLSLEASALLHDRARLDDEKRFELSYYRKIESNQTSDVWVAFRDLIEGGLPGLQRRLDARWHGKAGRVDGISGDPDPGRP